MWKSTHKALPSTALCDARSVISMHGGCPSGILDRGLWLRLAQQYLRCALVRGRGILFRYYCQSMAKSAGKDFRDGAVMPFE